MVRRSVVFDAFAAAAGLVLVATLSLSCANEREMSESLEMTDTTAVMRAMREASSRDALLDTMPGGEMARGDTVAELKLLRKKM